MYGSVLFYFLLLYFRAARANRQVDEAYDKSRWFFFSQWKTLYYRRCHLIQRIVLHGHVFSYIPGEGDRLIVDGMKLVVTDILKGYDLALIEFPPDSVVEITELGSATELEQAELINDVCVVQCRMVNAGASLLFLGFQCSNMPEPEDSVSPILQTGKVIGLMSSITLDTCMGIAISSSILRSLER